MRSVLLVEDNRIDIINVQRAFRKNLLPNTLNVVRNGEEALHFLRGDPFEGPKRPDFILLDLNMPAMNGTELLAAMKADPKLRTIPVVVLSTSNEAGDRRTCFRLGAAGYFVKPLDFKELVEVIRTIALYWNLSELP